MFYKDKSELITNTNVDKITNSDIGDIFAFAEIIIQLEKTEDIVFTKDLDRDAGLADLYRLCLKDFCTEKSYEYFGEYAEIWLKNKEASLSIPEEVIECCPNCGNEININLPKDVKQISFCPFCGQRNIMLCSRCMDLNGGDCRPKSYNSFCYKLGIDYVARSEGDNICKK